MTNPMAKTRLPVLAGPEGLTTEWLTAALRSTGALAGGSVASFTRETVGEGIGLMGQLARVEMEIAGPADAAPRALIAKFASAAAENREIAALFRFYEKEVRFYEQVAADVSMRTPACYFAAFDPDSGRFVLLLEDLSHLRPGDQLTGCTGDEAILLASRLARLHAGWWEHARLDDLGWLPRIDDPIYAQGVPASFEPSWAPFAERYRAQVSDALRGVGAQFHQLVPAILDRMATAPRTMLHGDFRLDNVFFGAPDGDDAAVIIDWQIMSAGRGSYDLAYLMSQSIDPPERRACERETVEAYHGALEQHGVSGYSLDQCWDDYRLGTLFCLVYPVIGFGTLDFANERGVALNEAMSTRALAAITDLDALELIPGA